ncbi:transcription factor CP2-like protein 1 [Cinclus cinclus]|uniref:transcription factor CP2-like protein 1 n=1 Tax=Cinclus cinclus TaxID=127875 RepID=UPI002E0DAC0B
MSQIWQKLKGLKWGWGEDTQRGVLGWDNGTGGALCCPPHLVLTTDAASPSPVFTVNTPNWAQLAQTGHNPAPITPPCAYKSGGGATHLSFSAVTLCLWGVPPPAPPTMLFWHGQPDHYWSSPGDMYPLPSSGVLRDPPVLPYLKQEEPNGISTSQPAIPAFQYILSAPTSPAVRHHEETLTYLNQGQSYEIRMMGTPRGDPAEGRRMVKSVVRVVFHDRRLQYSEQQQLEGWRWSRPGDRILDIDIPLSVGILEPQIHPTLLNTVEFLWDPSRRTSVFVQVHCISTEFTLRKNGGEKGVPFRIQIDTFGAGGKGDPPEHLHSASCLVKVFKPKGADRKQKTDREKVEKQPAAEREKFQPAYESTVLAECPPWPDALGAPHSPPGTPGLPSPHPYKLLSPERVCVSPACTAEGPAENPGEALSPCASPLETQQWLLRRRFSACARVFANFTGADLLKLSRRDLIQICGAPDGIRLCHALAGRCPRPRLTLYVAREPGGAEAAEDAGSGLYQELHLEQLTVAELTGKLAELLGLPPGQILRLSRQGPAGIHVLVSDAMIRNLQDETSFVVAMGKAPGPDGFELLLR